MSEVQLMDENRITMAALAGQQGLNVCTVWRWAKRGVRGVRLETYAVGGRRFTTVEAFRRFVQATSAAVVGPPTAATPRRATAKHNRAMANLSRSGI